MGIFWETQSKVVRFETQKKAKGPKASKGVPSNVPSSHPHSNTHPFRCICLRNVSTLVCNTVSSG